MQTLRFSLRVLFCAIVLITMNPGGVSLASSEEDCADLYFGINGAPNYPKALKCYESLNSWEFLILMHLNGEGAPADNQKAAELFRAWQKASPDESSSLQAEALKNAIQERKSNPKASYPPLKYCTDIAGDTQALNFCGWIEEQKAETRFKTVIAKAKAKLNPSDAVLFDRIVEAFYAFKTAETQRMYQLYIDGTIRNMASLGQGSLVREQFLKLVEETILQPGLKPANEKDYKVIDDELNQVYREGLKAYTEDYENRIKDDSLKEFKEEYLRNIQEYKNTSKQAQLCWIKYRDKLAELARSLYKDRAKMPDAVVSMKTTVTKIRVVELRHDPVQ